MRVLFVDDEPKVLAGFRRQLRKHTDIHTATSGQEGLSMLDWHGPFALVVSDMRMPGMSGTEFLAQVRARSPDTVRMVLSGQADLESAIAAVNEGHIFRFLTKPCDTETLWAAVEAGLEQHRLITSERELLEHTLQGVVSTLTEILGLTNPVARQRTLRVRHYVAEIAAALGFEPPWDLRLATLLSQLGCVNLPPALLDKLYDGIPLGTEERQQYRGHPDLAARLVERIPRLGSVARIIGQQQSAPDFGSLPPDIYAWDQETLSAVILAMAATLDERMAAGDRPATALHGLEQDLPGLPRELREAVRRVHHHSAYMDIRFLEVGELAPGMVVDEDVVSASGERVIARGQEVTRASLESLQARGTLPGNHQRVRVLVPA